MSSLALIIILMAMAIRSILAEPSRLICATCRNGGGACGDGASNGLLSSQDRFRGAAGNPEAATFPSLWKQRRGGDGVLDDAARVMAGSYKALVV